MNDLVPTTTTDWRDLCRRDYNGEWLPPLATPENRQIALQALEFFGPRMAPSKPDSVVKWLTALGSLTVAKISADEAKTKAASYADMLDFPAGCYSKASLKSAAEKFQFFPSYSEISKFLDDEKRRLMKDHHRLTVVAHHQSPPNAPAIDRSPEAVERWNAALASLVTSWKV